jgi:hypothetical protein
MAKLFNYDIKTTITPTLLGLILFLLTSITYLVLTVINYNGEPIGNDLNLEINSIPLFTISVIVLILYITSIQYKYLRLLSFIIIPFSVHILVSYGDKYPGTLRILRNKDKNPTFENKNIKNIAIFGTITAIIGILIGVILRFKLFLMFMVVFLMFLVFLVMFLVLLVV